MWIFGKRSKKSRRNEVAAGLRRWSRPEVLEPRRLMAADPVHVGVVYLETDYLNTTQDQGADTLPDRFLLSFTGGAPNTELTELRINTDKDNDGISIGDLIFDTAVGGRGKEGAHPLRIVAVNAADARATVTGLVEDGGTLLTLQFQHFRAGDTVEFSLDVDEVLRMSNDLDFFNSRLDVIASGQEFQDSILTATFNAPHYETAVGQDVFLNDYGDPRSAFGLNLPPDVSNDPNSRPNRSAAAVASTQQVPKPISISGTVFVDNNLNLRRDAGESTLSGVGISLWQLDEATGNYVDTGFATTTDNAGNYTFGTNLGLLPGTYRVIETQPNGYFSVGAIPGRVDGVTTGTAANDDILTSIAIPLGDLHGVSYDFAEALPARISGYVYRDDSDDGIRDTNEPGIGNVRVQLVPVDTIVPQTARITTTAADGSYAFENLAPGTYRLIELDQPVPYTDGLDTAGTINNQTVGRANNPGDSITEIILLGGVRGIEYNFGELPLGSISGYVFMPQPGEDCEGPHDEQSIPLANVIVRLFDSSGNLFRETRTGADGTYRFSDVPKGTYRIEEITPAGLIDGDAHVGTIDNIVVGTTALDGSISEVRLPAGRDGVRYDFCEAAPASVSGYVYHDRSNDGLRGTGEEGIRGATVRLIDASGDVVATTTTDENGFYEFKDLLPGTYRISEVTPDGYLDGLDRAGQIAGTTVGAAVNPGDRINDIVLKQGQRGVEYNFGELVPAVIQGRVHVDLDDDCILDPNEQTLEGVVIRLLDQAGTEIARTTTAADGTYQFRGLRPGRYTIVQEQPTGYFNGGQVAGSTGGDASQEDRISLVPVSSGQQSLNNNFCENPPSQLSGRVFADRDEDCVFDANEPAIAGVRIELLDATGRVIATTTTNSRGEYSFTNLRAGQYTVRETQPIGYLEGGQRAGSGGGDDSRQNLISNIAIGWGVNLIEYDFCELEPSSIAGKVFVDNDGDCVHEPEIGERPLAGVTIRLHDADGRIIATQLTNADGTYRFDNLRPGTYRVSEVQPEGFFQGGTVVGSGGGVILADDIIGEILLGANQRFVNYDFCEQEPAQISGTVYVDNDGDCVYEPTAGERPLPGVEIQLFDQAGNLVATTTTNAQGQYSFTDLKPGEYQVREVQPAGYYQGGQVVGSEGGRVLGDDWLGEIALGSGRRAVNYDFCELPGSNLSGRVWEDIDTDKQFDPTERPLEGVAVELVDAAGRVVARTTTNAEGLYQFNNLAPGVYSVREIQPTGLFTGGQIAGSHGGNDTLENIISAITVPAGSNLVRYDFPEFPAAKISGYVFQDGEAIETLTPPDPLDLREFKDGRFTSDDTPLAGVVLELRSLFGTPFTSTVALPGTYPEGPIRVVTDANGYYEFVGLRPNTTYHVYQVQPDGFIDGLDTPGTVGQGIAVNVADIAGNDQLQILVTTLAASPETNPGADAILSLFPGVGQSLQFNNFSEIVIDPPDGGPRKDPEPPQFLPPIVQPPETFPEPVSLYLGGPLPPFIPLQPLIGGDRVTWHLSVINGGAPRGAGLDDAAIILPASSKEIMQRWTSDKANLGKWRLFDADGNETTYDREIVIGVVDGLPIVGDFDGDGRDEVAMFFDGQWLIDLNGNGQWDPGDLWVQLGSVVDKPVAGDWDGDGKDDVGIFGPEWERDPEVIPKDPGLPDPDNQRRRGRKNTPPNLNDATNGHRLLQKTTQGKMRADVIDHVFRYGSERDIPLVGDWNGDGIDTIAVYQAGTWRLDLDGDGRWSARDGMFEFGQGGDIPLVGDWNGDGIDELVIVRGDLWIIDVDGDRRLTDADVRIRIPRANDEIPVMGDWDGDGRSEPGLYRLVPKDEAVDRKSA